MDQLKTIAKQVQKHHFWLLCATAMIMALTGWIMASRSLSAVYAERKIAIMAKFTDLQGIQSTENPPNNEWKTAIDKLTDEERKKVASAWALVYNQQKDLLRWPEELGPQFLNFVNTKPQNAEIPQQFCGYYMDNVKNEFPKLSAIINADGQGTKPAAAAAAKPDQPTASPPDKPSGASTSSAKVAWDAANQSEIQRTLTWSTIPTSQQVRLAQEDLWVYQALLQIIRKVNEGHHVAPVRKIAAITIGRPQPKNRKRVCRRITSITCRRPQAPPRRNRSSWPIRPLARRHWTKNAMWAPTAPRLPAGRRPMINSNGCRFL